MGVKYDKKKFNIDCSKSRYNNLKSLYSSVDHLFCTLTFFWLSQYYIQIMGAQWWVRVATKWWASHFEQIEPHTLAIKLP